MFERFDEDARRSLFFARGVAAERDGDEITSEDLLGGIVMGAPHAVARFASQQTDNLVRRETGEQFLRRVFGDERAQTGAASKAIPFSAAVKLAIERGVQEADDLRHTTVLPEHLLLGLLRDEKTQAWRTLHEAGVSLREVRRIMGLDR
jgi:ATP-dependent Clp protease ATP-binding subunit ClpC